MLMKHLKEFGVMLVVLAGHAYAPLADASPSSTESEESAERHSFFWTSSIGGAWFERTCSTCERLAAASHFGIGLPLGSGLAASVNADLSSTCPGGGCMGDQVAQLGLSGLIHSDVTTKLQVSAGVGFGWFGADRVRDRGLLLQGTLAYEVYGFSLWHFRGKVTLGSRFVAMRALDGWVRSGALLLGLGGYH